MKKLKDRAVANWYAKKIVENDWSRKLLSFQVDQNLYARQGTKTKKISNFSAALPAPQSEIAHEVLKDPFKFEFLSLNDTAKERDVENGLVNHIRDFLLELGSGFSFVGHQYSLY